MTSLDYLKALLKTIGVDEEDDTLLELMLDEAQNIFKHLTNRTNYSKYQSAVARIAFFNYQKLGDEAKKSYSAGSVSISYSEIREALKGYLPPPLILLGGKKVDCEELDVRIDYTKPLIVHVVKDFPEVADGSLIYNETDSKYYGGSNGKWIEIGIGDKPVSPTIDVVSNTETEYILKITDINGEKITPNLKGKNGVDGTKGKDGTNGINGEDGKDGFSPIIEVKTNTDEEYTLSITDKNGTVTTPNLKGKDGKDAQGGTGGTSVTVGGIVQETWNADTKANVSDIPTKTSQLENDSSYAVKSEIPTQTSQLNNDSGFITNANIPTKTSELTNDSGFISNIPQATTELGGIRANPKQDSDTTEVRIDSNTGYLYCSGGSGGGNLDSKQDKPTTNNTAYGLNSLLNITTGEGNTSVGYKALSKITQGSSNVAIGNTTMELATGNNNIGVGRLALNLIQGNGNVAIGNYALQNSISASDNIGLGSSSLSSNINGNNNVALGIYSMQFNKDGSNNTAIGQNSLKFKIDGSNNTSSNNCTGVGFGTSISGDNQVQLGDSNTTTYCYGAIQNRSDSRDKADIQETELGLEFINKLRPSQFKWNYRDDYKGKENDGSKKRNRYHQGFIAQEVKSVMDELGVDFGGYQDHSINGGCDVLSLGYEEFIAPIVKAIQEQQLIINNLKSEIEALKKG